MSDLPALHPIDSHHNLMGRFQTWPGHGIECHYPISLELAQT